MPSQARPTTATTALRRTPLTVQLAYGQLALLTLTMVAMYALVLKNSLSDNPSPTKSAMTDEAIDTTSADGALASSDPLVRGEALYAQSCAACHQPTGGGLPGVFPPLAGSDYLLADPERAVGIVLHGLSGPVTVNGVAYESVMPPIPFEDADVAAVVTYVLQAWGNKGPAVSPQTVARIRAAGPKS